LDAATRRIGIVLEWAGTRKIVLERTRQAEEIGLLVLHAVHIIPKVAAAVLLHQAVDVRLETGKAFVETRGRT
jgi:hypothetical protein